MTAGVHDNLGEVQHNAGKSNLQTICSGVAFTCPHAWKHTSVHMQSDENRPKAPLGAPAPGQQHMRAAGLALRRSVGRDTLAE